MFEKSPIVLGVMTVFLGSSVCADVMDHYYEVQEKLNQSALHLYADDLAVAIKTIPHPNEKVALDLQHPSSKELWKITSQNTNQLSKQDLTELTGRMKGRLQHILALEMMQSLRAGDVSKTKEWRALIDLPKYASAIDGALALHRLGKSTGGNEQITKLLVKEYIQWQSTRVREKTQSIASLILQNRATPELLAARMAEVESLANFPAQLTLLIDDTQKDSRSSVIKESKHISQKIVSSGQGQGQEQGPSTLADFKQWRNQLESTLPNLLTAEDAKRLERLTLKLIRLIPMEYRAGIRDSKIVIPIEYQEAKAFTLKTRQILRELYPIWQKTKAEAVDKNWGRLESKLEKLQIAIANKVKAKEVESLVKETQNILTEDFVMSLRRSGNTRDAVDEAGLEVRAFLGQSLQAALNDEWRDAERYRLEAYTTFDLEIEARLMPRDPDLALQAEASFIGGNKEKLGIKAALDRRLPEDELHAAYTYATQMLQESESVLKVGLSPFTVGFTGFTIATREGLEAVIILAALLAGFRGRENELKRNRLALGAWLALAASIVLFIISNTFIQSLSRYGEILEAVVSALAVAILLMVTNWVFHKFYWSEWNARLRQLSRSAVSVTRKNWEGLAMVGVGFATVFREGFETTIFIQSLILEGGWKPSIIGLGIGAITISGIGYAILVMGKKLPQRKLLVVTGILVVSILMTFVGKTVRLFQTVGWLPVHPIHELDIPGWMGLWFGLYPSWEGILIPIGALSYVGLAWFWVKFHKRLPWFKKSKEVLNRVPSVQAEQNKIMVKKEISQAT
ncbi:MAG: FTR1 family protein [Verrucomicrobiota bacterium]